jgi:hypothetical protein
MQRNGDFRNGAASKPADWVRRTRGEGWPAASKLFEKFVRKYRGCKRSQEQETRCHHAPHLARDGRGCVDARRHQPRGGGN